MMQKSEISIEEIISYIDEHLDEISTNWSQKVKNEIYNSYENEINSFGADIFGLMLKSLRGNDIEIEIYDLSLKLSYTRISCNLNITETVENLNLARLIVTHQLLQLPKQLYNLIEVTSKIDNFFNILMNKTIDNYIHLCNEKVSEQKIFIEETHKDRLTILGQLSASFVHEFRNPLTTISGFIKLLQKEEKDFPYLEIISYELDQLNFKINQFLHVSKKDYAEDKQFKLFEELCEEINNFLYPSFLESKTEVIYDIQKDCFFYGYVSEIKQVFLNILMNSIDVFVGMEANKKIFVDVHQDEKEITISIANNGPQIESKQISSIFEPFVTSKKTGTGIGLFVCKQIVEKHGGEISCISNPIMTNFIIKLPKNEWLHGLNE